MREFFAKMWKFIKESTAYLKENCDLAYVPIWYREQYLEERGEYFSKKEKKNGK